jgi:hypothetical protein
MTSLAKTAKDKVNSHRRGQLTSQRLKSLSKPWRLIQGQTDKNTSIWCHVNTPPVTLFLPFVGNGFKPSRQHGKSVQKKNIGACGMVF